ncbi:helix-turn-helix domain-containing protein [Ramlibacter sp. H39-3-26]|uniref:helix-turn-helix domain-containing protein n=1 Tax=Curvibacter soli TaxID=3031331 RepID=UPI0023D98F91|nr:helix-turn-helix domain-containing protein [Ramlibacter sp. H39-3-26]MDF1486689.1 helix-turn-helix domain-containing protein [Ramlibacter sp. H39-3-26]
MLEMFYRLDLAELTAEQLAPLEALMTPSWSDTWRDLATSHYLTLLSAPESEAADTASIARMAVALTMGVAQDLGGTQPYIPVGAGMMSSARTRRVIEMRAAGLPYKDVADACGITASRVRNIERAWRREQIALRQGSLALG